MRSSSVRRVARQVRFENLETRCVLSATLGTSAQEVTPLLKSLAAVVSPAASTSALPAGLSPAQVRAVYSFNNISFSGVTGDGKGTTIAIVDAYNDPNIVSDLKKFDKTFGIANPPSFKVVNQTGGTKLPRNNAGWASEIALDVEWAHAIAPGANILLVEANSSYTSDLNKALDFARNAPGVVVVSNSWGGSEYSTEKTGRCAFHHPVRTSRGHLHRRGRRQRCAGRISVFFARCAKCRRFNAATHFVWRLVERIGLVRRRRWIKHLRRTAELSKRTGHLQPRYA